MTADEAAELGPLVKEVSRAVQEVVDCDKTYVVQFAEHQDHPHVHVHVIPRARDLPHEHQGPRVFSLLGVPKDATVPDERMNEIANGSTLNCRSSREPRPGGGDASRLGRSVRAMIRHAARERSSLRAFDSERASRE